MATPSFHDFLKFLREHEGQAATHADALFEVFRGCVAPTSSRMHLPIMEEALRMVQEAHQEAEGAARVRRLMEALAQGATPSLQEAGEALLEELRRPYDGSPEGRAHLRGLTEALGFLAQAQKEA